MTVLLKAGTTVRVVPADAAGEIVTYRERDGERIYSVLTKTGEILRDLSIRDLADEHGKPFGSAGPGAASAPDSSVQDLGCLVRLAPVVAEGRAIRATETGQLRAFARLAVNLADLLEASLRGDAAGRELAMQVLEAAGRKLA